MTEERSTYLVADDDPGDGLLLRRHTFMWRATTVGERRMRVGVNYWTQLYESLLTFQEFDKEVNGVKWWVKVTWGLEMERRKE